jgi:hypothetical protein
MNSLYPMSSSAEIAKWAAEVLSERGIDEVATWRMLEYWLQVELYRAMEDGTGGVWRHLGEYEQPYFTDQPNSGSKTKTKWIDLIFATPPLNLPDRIVWIELKDIGRSSHTIVTNAKGLGYDLAALWSLCPVETQQLWLNPPPHAIDRGRLTEWNNYGPGLLNAKHMIAQIVLVPKPALQFISDDEMENLWLSAFEQRIKSKRSEVGIIISRAETKLFIIHALIHDLPRTNHTMEANRDF